MNVSTHLATDAEGLEIRRLIFQLRTPDESLDFSRVSPFWILAELDGKIVGCVQTAPSRPWGYLENLHVDQTLTKRERAAVVLKLLLDGCAVLYHHGATHVTGFVPDALSEYKDFLEKRGATIWDRGSVMMRRVA